MKKLTTKALISEVRRLAEKSPNNIYKENGCQYQAGNCTDGSIGCLIGQALRTFDIYEESGKTIARRIEWGDLPIKRASQKDLRWLETVQAIQDRHKPWSKAVEIADFESGLPILKT